MPTLYDAHGRPVRSADLVREHAAPSLTGVRQAWSTDTMANGLTPERLARILRNAAEGDHCDYLILAEEMEEREPHYASVLGTRKRAVSGLEPAVEAASDDARDQELADAVRELVAAPAFGDMLDDALDALGKGYSATEIMWDRSGARWTPERYEWRDPRFFLFDQATGRELRLLDERDMMGLPLPPYKFIVHVPRLKSGLPVRSGLARLAATSFMCKNYALTDWLAFAEVFGMPLRLGRYGENAKPEDIAKLIAAVANIGTDAAAVVPESMRIEFVEGGKATGGQELFERLAEWLDRQVSKGVLGQTMTSDDGSSQAQAKVHNEVRGDIQRADAKQLTNTINRDLVRAFIDLNWGPQRVYPRVTLPINEPEDVTALSEALGILVPLGLAVEASVIRDRLGLPDPEPGAEILGQPMAPAAEQPPQPSMATARAMNQAGLGNEDELGTIAADALGDWEPLMEGVVNPVQRLAGQCGSYDEFLARLPELLGQMDSTALMASLAGAAFKARGLGDAPDVED
ncbi:MAG: DUF935 domain-containing protein [Desulfovibrionaceae bacterium]